MNDREPVSLGRGSYHGPLSGRFAPRFSRLVITREPVNLMPTGPQFAPNKKPMVFNLRLGGRVPVRKYERSDFPAQREVRPYG